MRLGKRLEAVFDLIPQGTVCDIGTDHGKICVHSVRAQKCTHAYACDVREGPLNSAIKLIKQYGLENVILPFLSDGMSDLPRSVIEDTDCFVLAGMGGELIIKILRETPVKTPLVLQPQSATDELIEYLYENGYVIKKRVFCREGEHLYTAMYVEYDGLRKQPRYFDGVVKSEAYTEYLESNVLRTHYALKCINGSENSDKARVPELERKLEIYLTEYKKNEN